MDGAAINIVTGGSATSVVRELKNTDQTITSATASPGTNMVYGKITGTITHPGLSLTQRAFGNASITSAVDDAIAFLDHTRYKIVNDYLSPLFI